MASVDGMGFRGIVEYMRLSRPCAIVSVYSDHCFQICQRGTYMGVHCGTYKERSRRLCLSSFGFVKLTHSILRRRDEVTVCWGERK